MGVAINVEGLKWRDRVEVEAGEAGFVTMCTLNIWTKQFTVHPTGGDTMPGCPTYE